MPIPAGNQLAGNPFGESMWGRRQVVESTIDDPFKGKCRSCFWNRNLPRCEPAKMITQSGSCPNWRMYKLSDADKVAEKAKQAGAYLRDKEKRKLTRKQRRKDGRGGA